MKNQVLYTINIFEEMALTIKLIRLYLSHQDMVEIDCHLIRLDEILKNWLEAFPAGSQNFPTLQFPHVVGAVKGFIRMMDYNGPDIPVEVVDPILTFITMEAKMMSDGLV